MRWRIGNFIVFGIFLLSLSSDMFVAIDVTLNNHIKCLEGLNTKISFRLTILNHLTLTPVFNKIVFIERKVCTTNNTTTVCYSELNAKCTSPIAFNRVLSPYLINFYLTDNVCKIYFGMGSSFKHSYIRQHKRQRINQVINRWRRVRKQK